MISEISRILAIFRPCFTRMAAFNWFVTVVFGFIVRIDLCGASSFMRWLGIKPALYTAMLSFFPGIVLAVAGYPAVLVAHRAGALPTAEN
jgi:hypothetical protein